MRIIDVTPDNVEETGFFCLMSRRKSDGYQRKLRWLEARFDEGLRIKMLDLSKGGRGFIEYIPGEYAWRPVEASGYLFIHCLWVVGKSKGNGYAKQLLRECIADAKRCGAQGVAMVTSAQEIREQAPSPHGVFTIVFDGEVLSHYFQPKKKLNELLDTRISSHG